MQKCVLVNTWFLLQLQEFSSRLIQIKDALDFLQCFIEFPSLFEIQFSEFTLSKMFFIPGLFGRLKRMKTI